METWIVLKLQPLKTLYYLNTNKVIKYKHTKLLTYKKVAKVRQKINEAFSNMRDRRAHKFNSYS